MSTARPPRVPRSGFRVPGCCSKRETRNSKLAFTLVELLVAMAVLIVVTMSTMLVFRSVTQAWRSGQLRTERYQQARLLFDLFARELSSCVANPRYPFLGTDAGAGQSVKEDTTRDELAE